MKTLHVFSSGTLGRLIIQRAWLADGTDPAELCGRLVYWQMVLGSKIEAVALDGELLEMPRLPAPDGQGCAPGVWAVRGEAGGSVTDVLYLQGVRPDLVREGELDLQGFSWRVFAEYGLPGLVDHEDEAVSAYVGSRSVAEDTSLWDDIAFAVERCLAHLPEDDPQVLHWASARTAPNRASTESVLTALGEDSPPREAALVRRLLALQERLLFDAPLDGGSKEAVEDDEISPDALWESLQCKANPVLTDTVGAERLLTRVELLALLGLGDNVLYRLEGRNPNADNGIRNRCHPLRFLPSVRKGRGSGRHYLTASAEEYLTWQEGGFATDLTPTWVPPEWRRLRELGLLPDLEKPKVPEREVAGVELPPEGGEQATTDPLVENEPPAGNWEVALEGHGSIEERLLKLEAAVARFAQELAALRPTLVTSPSGSDSRLDVVDVGRLLKAVLFEHPDAVFAEPGSVTRTAGMP